jgi:hypothetical protein
MRRMRVEAVDKPRPDVLTLTVHGKEVVLPFFAEEKGESARCRRWRSPKKEGLVVSQILTDGGTACWLVALFGPWPGFSYFRGHEPLGTGPTLGDALKDFEECCRRWVDYLLLKETYPEEERKR